MEKVLVAMSGGVDSSVAAFLLKQQGYLVSGATAKLLRNDCATELNCRDAQNVARSIDAPHHVIIGYDPFEKSVINDFIRSYEAGLTPNPCIECNRTIKFGLLLEHALSSGYDKLATGHYLSSYRDVNGTFFLKKARDTKKDQSYFLWSIDKRALPYLLFPLGDLTKSEIREIAQQNGLVCADRPDSQDICFIKDGDYAAFIKKNSQSEFPSGDFTDLEGNVIGRHQGIINYTVGQRKGLGTAFGKPMFVCNKIAADNTVVLCEDAELYRRELTARRINLFFDDTLEHPTRLLAKIRYRHEPSVATVQRIGQDAVSVIFDLPQRAITPGQSVVLYDGDTLVGGGIIE